MVTVMFPAVCASAAEKIRLINTVKAAERVFIHRLSAQRKSPAAWPQGFVLCEA